MKKDVSLLLIVTFCVAFCTGCSGPASKPTTKQDIDNKTAAMDTSSLSVNFVETILQIDKSSENNGTWEVLFADKEFIKIYENGSYYIDSAIQFLADDKFSLRQKTICIYSMQRAKLEEYIRFFEQCKILFENGRLSELLLSKAISPTFGKRRPIVENYENASIRRLLENIRHGQRSSPDLKGMIEKVLSGKYGHVSS